MSIQNNERADPLKHIAGLIQKLSYRDMQRLGASLARSLPVIESGSRVDANTLKVAEALLNTADELLAGPGLEEDSPTFRSARNAR